MSLGLANKKWEQWHCPTLSHTGCSGISPGALGKGAEILPGDFSGCSQALPSGPKLLALPKKGYNETKLKKPPPTHTHTHTKLKQQKQRNKQKNPQHTVICYVCPFWLPLKFLNLDSDTGYWIIWTCSCVWRGLSWGVSSQKLPSAQFLPFKNSPIKNCIAC